MLFIRNQQEKRLQYLLKNISERTKIRTSDMLIVINNNLEYVFDNNINKPKALLNNIEKEYKILVNEGVAINNKISDAQNNITQVSNKIIEIQNIYNQKKQELDKLIKTNEQFQIDIIEINKEIKKNKYEILLNNEYVQKKTNKNYTYASLILSIFTLLGIIVFLLIKLYL